MALVGLGLNILTSDGVDYREKPLPAIPKSAESDTHYKGRQQEIYSYTYPTNIKEDETPTIYHYSPTIEIVGSSTEYSTTSIHKSLVIECRNLQLAEEAIAINAISYQKVITA